MEYEPCGDHSHGTEVGVEVGREGKKERSEEERNSAPHSILCSSLPSFVTVPSDSVSIRNQRSGNRNRKI